MKTSQIIYKNVFVLSNLLFKDTKESKMKMKLKINSSDASKIQWVLLHSRVQVENGNDVTVHVRNCHDYLILRETQKQTHNFVGIGANPFQKIIKYTGLNERSYIYCGAVERSYMGWMNDDFAVLSVSK